MRCDYKANIFTSHFLLIQGNGLTIKNYLILDECVIIVVDYFRYQGQMNAPTFWMSTLNF